MHPEAVHHSNPGSWREELTPAGSDPIAGVGAATTPAGGARVACATDLVGIALPQGFCATIFAGIWQFDLNRLHQTQAQAPRFATGIRNAVAFTKHPTTGELYAMQHGRDPFFQNRPKLYNAEEGANGPSYISDDVKGRIWKVMYVGAGTR